MSGSVAGGVADCSGEGPRPGGAGGFDGFDRFDRGVETPHATASGTTPPPTHTPRPHEPAPHASHTPGPSTATPTL